jgi:hypothetical protein
LAREKSLDAAIVRAWLAVWNESDAFSDAAVRHLQSFITDPLCLVVVTLGVGHEPRSLVFRHFRHVVPVTNSSEVTPKPTLRHLKDMFKLPVHTQFPSMFVSPVPPMAPSVGQLWQQTGLKSEKFPKLERVLRWDGEDWLIAGHVTEGATIMKQGKQACDFQEALACAHAHTRWLDCEFIYTYDGSTWGNA